MARTKVTATYKPNETELFQVVVYAASSYPDALNEAAVTATKSVRTMIHDALEAYPAKTD